MITTTGNVVILAQFRAAQAESGADKHDDAGAPLPVDADHKCRVLLFADRRALSSPATRA